MLPGEDVDREIHGDSSSLCYQNGNRRTKQRPLSYHSMLVLDKNSIDNLEKPLELAKNRIQKGLRPFTMEEDMTDQSDSKKITATYQTLFDMGMKALQRVGVPEPDARTTMDVLLRADLRGVASHGIQRLLQYVPRFAGSTDQPSSSDRR